MKIKLLGKNFFIYKGYIKFINIILKLVYCNMYLFLKKFAYNFFYFLFIISENKIH